MKALSVHGGGAELESMSDRVGSFEHVEAVSMKEKLAGREEESMLGSVEGSGEQPLGLGEGERNVGGGSRHFDLDILLLALCRLPQGVCNRAENSV